MKKWHYVGTRPNPEHKPICGLRGDVTANWLTVTCGDCKAEQRRRIQQDYNSDPDGDIEGADYVR